MKNILLFIFTFISFSLFGQFRMVGTGSWSTVNDSTYTANITFASDLTGKGYLATQIDSGFQVFTPTEGMYRIDSVWNKTFSSASLRVIEMFGTNGSPFGQIEVFNPDGKLTVPDVPFGSTGATAQLNAAVVTWNARNGGAGIDSTTTSNDSQFVWAGGVAYFSGLADAPRPNNGRVWYVSKSNPSCSASAVVGDPTRPFCNPWQAIDSVQAGDHVNVSYGNYTIGSAGSGADWEGAAFLWFDGSWHFEEGARIETVTTGGYFPIFNSPTTQNVAGESMIVTGRLVVESAAGSVTAIYDGWSAATLGAPRLLSIEMDSAMVTSFMSCQDTIENLYCKANYVATQRRAFFLAGTKFANLTINELLIHGTGNNGDPTYLGSIFPNSYHSMKVGRFTHGRSNAFGVTGLPFGVNTESLHATLDIDELVLLDTMSCNSSSVAKVWDGANTGNLRNSYVRLSIGEITDNSTETKPLFNFRNEYRNSDINVEIGKGGSVSSSLWNQTLSLSDSVRINMGIGKWVQGGSIPAFDFNVAGTTSEISISGDYTSDVEVANIDGAYRNFEFNNARLRSYGNSAILTNDPVTLFSTRLIVPDGVAAIANIADPVSVIIMNSFTNSLIIDSDVTELVEPLLKHISVK